MTATPGTFWDAMVTTNRGSATPTTAPGVKRGVTQTGRPSARRTASTCRRPWTSAIATPTSSAMLTAYRGARRRARRKEDDRRAGEAHQHGHEAGDDRRNREIPHERHRKRPRPL